MDTLYPLSSNHMGVNIDGISEMLGFNIDMLIGMDILAHYHIIIQAARLEILFHTNKPTFDGEVIDLDLLTLVPILSVVIDDQPIKAFFDTGAKLCYFDSEVTEQYPAIRDEQDFYPGYGSFITTVSNTLMTVGNNAVTLTTGSLPEELPAMLLEATGVEGIIGTPLLDCYTVCLSFPDKQMILQ